VKKKEKQSIQQEEIENYVNERMHKIKHVEIPDNNEDGFNLLVTTTGGIKGEYNVLMSIKDKQTTFLELTESINIESNVQIIRRKVDYINLFQKCFNELKESNVYVCIEGAGTSESRFEIDVRLILIEDNEEKMKNLDNYYKLEQSNAAIGFVVDTFTRDGKVIVEKFQLDSIR